MTTVIPSRGFSGQRDGTAIADPLQCLPVIKTKITRQGFAFFFTLVCLIGSSRLQAQSQAFPDLDLPTLGQRAESAFPQNPEEGIPYMLEIRERLTGAVSEGYQAIYRENLYMLGLAHMNWYQQSKDPAHLEAGIPFWDEFIEKFANDERLLLARLNRADSYFGSEQWGEAVDAYLQLLSLYRFQLKESDLMGAMQGLLAAAESAERQAGIEETFREFIGPDFSGDVRLFSLNVLFDRALENNKLDELLALVALINRERHFRYDLGVNLRLLNLGDRFEEEERYLEAGLLFSMVLPVEQLLFLVEDRLIEVEEQLFKRQYIASERPALESQLGELREQRAALVEAPKYTANLRWRQARVLRLMGRTFEAFFAFRRLLREYPQHEHIEQFHYAAFLQGLECAYTEEATKLGEDYLEVPAYLLFEKPIALRLANIYKSNQEIAKLSALADEFLHRFPYEPVAAQMVHLLGHALFVQGETEAIIETFPFWVEEFPDGSFVDSVDYWSGMSSLFVGDFEGALGAFDRLIETHPGSVYFKEARFRRAVAYFGIGDYAKARELFQAWLASSDGHPLEAEAHVFLGDLDAMEAEVEGALAHYEQVETLGGSQALIDHAYFESSALLLANKRYEDNADLLLRYLDRYPDSPAGSQAVLRLADADLEQGKIASAFERYRDGIARFGNSVAADHVDHLIDAWWTTDAGVRTRVEQSRDFIERLMADEAFRSLILYDRVAQIRYFQEHAAIPESIQSAFTIRQPLYEALAGKTRREGPSGEGRRLDVADYEMLATILSRLSRQAAQLPDARPEEVFAEMRTTALEQEKGALALRLLRILNLRAGVAVGPAELGREAIEEASPATLVWIAKIKSTTDPYAARNLLEQAIERAPVGATAAEALFLLAELEMEARFYVKAAEYYQEIVETYTAEALAPLAAVRRGDALREARRYDEAIEAYSMVINQRDWRGEVWAEATFKIGLCFQELDENGKAQGFFERTYLAYSGYPQWSGKAVLESATFLERSGDYDSARRTYEFFLNSPGAAESPLHEVIRQRFQAL